MKTKFTKTIKTLVLTTTMLVTLNLLSAKAQLTPAIAGDMLFCHDSDLDLKDAPTGTKWVVFYSVDDTDTPPEGVDLDGNFIRSVDLKTGYYHVAVVGLAEGSCISEFEKFPVYKFAPLTVAFTSEDYCEEDVADQAFVGTATTTESTALSYQWYTVSGGTETKIDGANTEDYKPVASVTAGTTTTYRLKAGYLVNSLRYCSVIVDHNVTVTAKPDQPTITVTGVTGEEI